MEKILNVLLVEDSDADAALIERTLQKYGFEPIITRVQTAGDLISCLESERQTWDIILSDYNLPQFDGLKALQIVKDKLIDTPFILVSGAVGEENAVKLMRAGAHDYVMKDRLHCLGPAIDRAINEAELRRESQREKETTKRLEKQLRQAQKLESIGTLAGGIAHDFNNILTAILGYADLARDDIAECNPASNYLKEVIKAGNRAKELVKHILTFSRKSEQCLCPVALGSIVKEALKLLRATIPATIEIRQRVDSDSSIIIGDPTQIHQIIMNLCTNAAQAMEEKGGLIEVVINPVTLDEQELAEANLLPGPYVQLIVKDDGPGIAPAYIDRVFEPYFTTKAMQRGTGMGLAVVHGIVKSHGGMIRLESRLGEGCCFSLYFPQAEKDAAIPEDDSGTVPTGNERILFVDDEPVLVDLSRQVLSSLGYQVTTFVNSIDALNAFKDHPDQFDLIITDQTMPRLPGTELAKEILQTAPAKPIILCSGFSSLVDEEKARMIGISEFAMKPLGKKEIANLIRKVLDGH